jgi:hypothetical protein
MRIIKKTLAFMVMVVLLSAPAAASSQDQAVATGDGFVLTALEVNRICEPYNKGNPQLSDKQCLNLALRVRLFSAEAERMGLPKGGATGKKEGMSVEKMKELSDLYMAKLMDDFPVEDVVIESYYWAHPEQFREKTDAKGGGGDVTPMNAEIRKTIRQTILSSKVLVIQKEAFERLKQTYRVKITDGKEGSKDENKS